MKKKNLLLGSILLTILSLPAVGKTTVTPYFEVESNTYSNVSTEKQDLISTGLSVVQTISDKTNISLDVKTTDYDYIGDDDNSAGITSAKSRERVAAYVNNQIVKSKNGATVNLGLGIQLDTSSVESNKAITYRLRPVWSYPVSKDITVSGDWLFAKDKTDKTNVIGDYSTSYELITGVKYTGIKNIALTGQIYNYAKGNVTKDNDSGETETQLRGIVSTKLSGITVSPWARIDLGKFKVTKTDGSEDATKEKGRNRFGIDLSKTINNVNYATSVSVQPTKYSSDSSKNETLKYVKLSATYTF